MSARPLVIRGLTGAAGSTSTWLTHWWTLGGGSVGASLLGGLSGHTAWQLAFPRVSDWRDQGGCFSGF